MIYVIGPDRVGAPVKIGIAGDPTRRLIHIQCGNPEKLFILNLFRAPYPDPAKHWEGIVHRALMRARLSGEWFDPWRDVRAEHLARASSAGAAALVWRDIAPSATDWPSRIKRSGALAATRELQERTPLSHTLANFYGSRPPGGGPLWSGRLDYEGTTMEPEPIAARL